MPALDHFILAKKWCILSKKALNMILFTTECGIGRVLHLFLARQFWKNDHCLRNRRLVQNFYIDVLFVNAASRRGNKCAHISATDFCWSCSFPMKQKIRCMRHGSCSLSSMGHHMPQYVTMFRICVKDKEHTIMFKNYIFFSLLTYNYSINFLLESCI